MDSQSREEAAEIKKLPTELLEYLPAKRWRRSIGALIAFFIVLAVFLGFMINQNIRYARSEAELNRYETLWNSQGISNYEFTLEGRVYVDSGLLHSKITVTVKDGVAISKQLEPMQGAPSAGELQFDNLDTVPKLFAASRKTLRDANILSIPAVSARINYNPDFGYPTYVSFGGTNLLGRAGYYSYQASFLRVLPYPLPAK